MSRKGNDKTKHLGNMLAEQLYGDGAFHAIGKFIVHNNGEGQPHLFAGTIVGAAPEGADGNHQMWECEIVIIPIRKFKDGGTFRGHRIDQVLTRQFGKREMWQQPPYWTKQGAERLWWHCNDCGHEFNPVGDKQPSKDQARETWDEAKRLVRKRLGAMTNGNESWLTAERFEYLYDDIAEFLDIVRNRGGQGEKAFGQPTELLGQARDMLNKPSMPRG